MKNNEKCKKCRWLHPNFSYGDLTSKNRLLLGTCSNPSVEFVEITPEDETMEYYKCTDFSPLEEFSDEEFANSFKDDDSEVMYFE